MFLVDELAMWSSLTETATAFKERFGTPIIIQHVAKYDANGAAGQQMAAKLRERFFGRRKEFVENVDAIPIANRAYRVKRLHEMHVAATKVGNRQQAAALLEQAAKETGGSYTNKQEIKHSGRIKGSEPVMTVEQMRNALADAVANAMEKK